jgi:hypothetical protein
MDLVDLVAFPSLAAAKGSPLHHSPRHFSALQLSKNVTGHTPWPVLVVLCPSGNSFYRHWGFIIPSY